MGRELATTYSNAEMMKLLQIHVQENVIDQETAGAMTGALTYKVRTQDDFLFLERGRKDFSLRANIVLSVLLLSLL